MNSDIWTTVAKLSLLALLVFFYVGCTKVEPWQKRNLSRPHMAFDTDPAESRFNQHTYQSKEACSGGYGVGGGGCGCN